MTIKKLLIVLIALCSFSFNSFADDKKKEKVEEQNLTAEEKEANQFEQIKIDRLKRIRRELVTIQSKINENKKKLKEDLDMVSRIHHETKLSKLQKEFNAKRHVFIETATSVSLSVDKQKKEKTTFTEDIQQILEPAITSFKKISERPRQIQELKERSNSIETRYNNAVEAKEKLEALYKANEHKELRYTLKSSIRTTDKLVKELKVKLEDIQFKIIKVEKNQESIVSTFSTLILEFIKTKGKNLFLAFLVFIGFFWGFRSGQNKVIGLVLYRLNTGDKKEMYQWIARPTKVLYKVITTLVALFLSILTLYVLNDWVLVTFILFVLAALIWSSKQYLPLFLEQSKIVLNLGTIREGERVMYGGLPWQIKGLSYYCRLVNPVLSGGDIRVSTKELLSAHSRRVNSNETWFPTKTGEWVEVNGVYGRVVVQSPEQVIVKEIGGQQHFFSAVDFYAASPTNLSQGFGIEFNFGVDYCHQEILFTEVIPNFKTEIKEAVFEKYEQEKEEIHDLVFEFASAGASSLDLRFFLKCSGKLAGKKLGIARFVQAELVKICNKHGYIIPFNQLTVHMNSEG